MTREELIREIAKRLKDIKELYYSVYPEGDYLSLFFEKDCISFHNGKWEIGVDENYPINYFENGKPYVRINKKQKDK